MDDRKIGLNRLVDYSKAYKMKVEANLSEKPLYSLGDASYEYIDLMVIYKINRMFELGKISEEDYYDLLEEYNTYLEASARLIQYDNLRYHGLLSKDTFEYDVRKLEDQLFFLQADLSELELLPDNVEFRNLVDETIKDKDYSMILERK